MNTKLLILASATATFFYTPLCIARPALGNLLSESVIAKAIHFSEAQQAPTTLHGLLHLLKQADQLTPYDATIDHTELTDLCNQLWPSLLSLFTTELSWEDATILNTLFEDPSHLFKPFLTISLLTIALLIEDKASPLATHNFLTYTMKRYEEIVSHSVNDYAREQQQPLRVLFYQLCNMHAPHPHASLIRAALLTAALAVAIVLVYLIIQYLPAMQEFVKTLFERFAENLGKGIAGALRPDIAPLGRQMTSAIAHIQATTTFVQESATHIQETATHIQATATSVQETATQLGITLQRIAATSQSTQTTMQAVQATVSNGLNPILARIPRDLAILSNTLGSLQEVCEHPVSTLIWGRRSANGSSNPGTMDT